VLLDGTAPDANLQPHAMIDFRSARTAHTHRHPRKVYRDVVGSPCDGPDYDAVEIDGRLSHAARRRET
jgi:hypothetical protein